MQRMMPPKDDVGKQAKRRRRRPLPGFDAVAGIDTAKRELEEVVDFIKRPERYTRLGARFPKGVLMHGPSLPPRVGRGSCGDARTRARCRLLWNGQDPPRTCSGARGWCVPTPFQGPPPLRPRTDTARRNRLHFLLGERLCGDVCGCDSCPRPPPCRAPAPCAVAVTVFRPLPPPPRARRSPHPRHFPACQRGGARCSLHRRARRGGADARRRA